MSASTAARLRNLAGIIDTTLGDDDETVAGWVAELNELALDVEHTQRELAYLVTGEDAGR